MAETLVTGIRGQAAVRVTEANMADKMGNAGVKVFATPMLVALMEQAAVDALLPYLAPDEGSVGTRVDVSHLAATPEGMTVRAVAELVEISGKRLTFTIEAFDDREKVGEGRHERYLVNMPKFLAKIAAKQ